MYFCIKKKNVHGCRIYYETVRDYAKADEKRDFLSSKPLSDRDFGDIRPDSSHNWLAIPQNDFELLMPVGTRAVKTTKKRTQERAIFKLFSLGVVTNRDEWVYDEDPRVLARKIRTLIDAYNADLAKLNSVRDSDNLEDLLDTSIKWTRAVKNDLRKGIRYEFGNERIIDCLYRPLVKRKLYFSRQLNEMQYQIPSIFGKGNILNRAIVFTDPTGMKPWMVCSVEALPDLHFVGAAAGMLCFPFKRLDGSGRLLDNVNDWALEQFKKHHQPGRAKHSRPITREAIFHYVYGVLHDPVYREKYAQNLKREFPRIPFYTDFWQWADWGKELMDLHIGYEQVEGFKLKRVDQIDEKSRKAGVAPKTMLKADKELGTIVLDSETTLFGIPREAWTYTLGNRSALDWILDQYKEKKPKDPTIREKFDTYRFADYKERVIDLLMRVTTVSVRTISIVHSMKLATR